MLNQMNFEDSLYNNERPPLPPKNFFKSAPPLPPKLNKHREFQKEIKIPLPNKTKEPSKHLFFNNNSYALTNFNDGLICSAEKVCEKKEVYENYDQKIIKIKKNSFLNKIKHILKKSKQNSQSKLEEDSSSSVISKNNKYNEIPEQPCQNKCSNVAICSPCPFCCRACHSHYHYYHRIKWTSQFSDHFSPINTSCHCQSRFTNHSHISDQHCKCCNSSSCNIVSSISSFNSQLSPIIPNRNRVEPTETNLSQLHIGEREAKSILPTKSSPMEKYSSNFLNKNLMELKKVGWYWGSVSSVDAERVMVERPNGTFLVRDSAHSDHLFSATFRVNHLTYHARIQFSQNKFWWNHNNHDDGFESVIELIQNSLEISRKGECRFFENTENTNVPPYAVSLLSPLSRFNVMCSLKHLTRFIIISNVRSDHLERLPLPPHLLSYLHDKEHHYIENVDRYVIMKENSDSKSIKSI